MILKVSSFHAYAHQDDAQDTIENCAICDVATENEDVDFLFPASQISIPSTVDFSYVTLPVTNKLVVPSFFLRNNFFGRPPPQTA